MKLFYSTASPFVRKVLVVAHEIGVAAAIQTIPVKMSPVDPNDELSASNPLGKIPALVLDDGMTLYDSRVICEYLDMMHDGPRLIPHGGPARWAALRRQALADGILEAGILVRYETLLRPEAQRSAEWMEGQCKKVLAGLRELEEAPRVSVSEASTAPLSIGDVAAACTVGWLAFRKPLETRPSGPVDVKVAFPQIARWYEAIRSRPSFAATEPSA